MGLVSQQYNVEERFVSAVIHVFNAALGELEREYKFGMTSCVAFTTEEEAGESFRQRCFKARTKASTC